MQQFTSSSQLKSSCPSSSIPVTLSLSSTSKYYFSLERSLLESNSKNKETLPSSSISVSLNIAEFSTLTSSSSSLNLLFDKLSNFVNLLSKYQASFSSSSLQISIAEQLPRCAWSHGCANVIGNEAQSALFDLFDHSTTTTSATTSGNSNSEAVSASTFTSSSSSSSTSALGGSTAIQRGLLCHCFCQDIFLLDAAAVLLWEVSRRLRLCVNESEVKEEFGYSAKKFKEFSKEEIAVAKSVAPQVFEEKVPFMSTSAAMDCEDEEEDEEEEEEYQEEVAEQQVEKK